MAWGSVIKGVFGWARRRQKNKQETKVAETKNAADSDKAQIDLAKQDSKHDSKFIAGWRPFVCWVCGIGFALYLLVGIVPAFMIIFGYQFSQLQIDQLALIREQLRQDVVEMLIYIMGLGYTLRTAEKFKGVARSGLGGVVGKVTEMLGSQQEPPAVTKRERKKQRKRNRKKK